MSSVNNNAKSQSEVPEQKEFIVHTAGKWLETIAVIFASVLLRNPLSSNFVHSVECFSVL